VENLDAYYEALQVSDLKLDAVLQNRRGQVLNELSTKRLLLLVPESVLRHYIESRARFSVWRHLENVDQKRLFQHPLSILPSLSQRLRSRILLFLIVGDKLAFWG